ncbi:MAG TPA: hypothetical protein VGM29_15470 [Polyangiaceae bacterium]
MSFEAAEKIARALMYEGYLLYPYRKSALKNQRRVAFGSLYPEVSSERSRAQLEVLLRAERVRVRVLFLHWARRQDPNEPAWLEAVDRAVDVGPFSLALLLKETKHTSFTFPAARWRDGSSELVSDSVTGSLQLSAEEVARGVSRLRVVLQNCAVGPTFADPERATLASLASAHVLVQAEAGEALSLLEPPDALQDAAARCKNDGLWPVLVGERALPNTLLGSPITLYDFPAVAPESQGDYFDATEIDEMLALRVRTLTEDEKEQARRTDPRARRILERTEQLSEEQMGSLHGAWREPPRSANSGGLEPGDRVRLRPRPGRDVFDLALADELATVISLEQDFEGRRFCTVTVDADPGRDLGVQGRPGHRFFFELEEVERVS